ncbi:branched-chain amino acid ABC transporter permease [Desulfocurvibacter africanus]|uniref:ABC-type transporter, integral membrane subunit n=1 Tax=Desulfocurvibacter africanus subsp. africanus str. Walvis Bay TaxID=690850 RepID=F3YXC6_DESAF|nr:branched-chain amino acid ABC transporter permease [Desulfocurvibacter africanus]EGJ50624.1 ABC-type transporter, integral membrane subunit [Desulfocurvibacter africanus subsp. africanus str. Walvis Bay]
MPGPNHTPAVLLLYFAQIINSGLALGSVYGLMAIGFALIYNSSRLINFAQGELLLLGGLGLFSLTQAMELNPFLALAAASIWGFLLGHFLYATTLGLAMSQSPLRQLMLTVAASLVWQGLAILVWGKKPLLLAQLLPMPEVRLGSLYFGRDTVTAMVLALASGAALSFFLRHTRRGRAIRAVSMNPLAARLQGINPKASHALAFALAGVLACMAGMAVGPQTMLRYDMGLGLGLKGFVAATIGGYSSLSRVFLGGLGLGLLEAALVLLVSAELKEALSFSLLIGLMLLMPMTSHEERA